MTVVDKIFTRIGASDRILEGKSTFYVEMEETKTIIEEATPHSLAILDELGRGTSTFDGYAIAHSVLNHIAENIQCRTLFSTHYHMLVETFRESPRIGFYHMTCKLNDSTDEVTFLYKFIKGECPKSYGINVARLAQIPEEVIQNAKKQSQMFRDCIEGRLLDTNSDSQEDEESSEPIKKSKSNVKDSSENKIKSATIFETKKKITKARHIEDSKIQEEDSDHAETNDEEDEESDEIKTKKLKEPTKKSKTVEPRSKLFGKRINPDTCKI